MARLKDVTTASRTMLQFSSRILMRGKRDREALVPASKVKGRWNGAAVRHLRSNQQRRLSDDLRLRACRVQDMQPAVGWHDALASKLPMAVSAGSLKQAAVAE